MTETYISKLPDAASLREMFLYNPETGALARREGDASSREKPTQRHYRRRRVNGLCVGEHQIIWGIMTGAWPVLEIDHKNGMIRDNRWTNLRLATHLQNRQNSKRSRNNTSGITGVSRHKASGKWRATIQYAHLGLFDSRTAAIAARSEASERLFGEFARRGQ